MSTEADTTPQALAQALVSGGLPATILTDERLHIVMGHGEVHTLPLPGLSGLALGSVRLVVRTNQPALAPLSSSTRVVATTNQASLDALATIWPSAITFLERHSVVLMRNDATPTFGLAHVWAGRELLLPWACFLARLASLIRRLHLGTSGNATATAYTGRVGDRRFEAMAQLLLSDRGLPVRIVSVARHSTRVETPWTDDLTARWLAGRLPLQHQTTTDNDDAEPSADMVQWDLDTEAPLSGGGGFAVLRTNSPMEALMVVARQDGDVSAAAQRMPAEWRLVRGSSPSDHDRVLINLARVVYGSYRYGVAWIEHSQRDDDDRPPLLRNTAGSS